MSVNDAPSSVDSTDAIDVALPLRDEHAGTLRVLVATLGADAGFSIDDIDDLKLAVSEVFNVLVDSAESVGVSRAHARFVSSPGSVEICLHRGRYGDTIELDELAAAILSSVVDTHRIDDDGVTLIKRRHETTA